MSNSRKAQEKLQNHLRRRGGTFSNTIGLRLQAQNPRASDFYEALRIYQGLLILVGPAADTTVRWPTAAD